MKILNLYAGIGGNRRLWGDDHEVTSVEYDEKIAAVYADLWPEDELVIGDAHEYLRQNYAEFDFIWSSPPCQTHSKARFHIGVQHKGFNPVFPDMALYEEIIFLQHHSTALWTVENVIPYYQPLIEAQKVGRHLYWSNFPIGSMSETHEGLRTKNKIADMEALHGFDLSAYSLPNKRQVLRNVASPNVAKGILDAAILYDVSGGED